MVHRAALSEDRLLATVANELGGQVDATTEEQILARERERLSKHTILFLAANPAGIDRLALG